MVFESAVFGCGVGVAEIAAARVVFADGGGLGGGVVPLVCGRFARAEADFA